ncbi:hypothetical protein, partial [Aquimarina sp. I32.4]|uniref:XAC2610-related protein n=1 Tax=Aquimarina sp. I32.4 TaxID=2053903 RepID=UPI001E616754
GGADSLVNFTNLVRNLTELSGSTLRYNMIKIIHYSISLLIFGLTFSCKLPLNEVNYYLGNRIYSNDILYKINFNKDTLSGHVIYLDQYLDEIDYLPLQGLVTKDSVKWITERFNQDYFSNTGILSTTGEIKIQRNLVRTNEKIDSVFLTKITLQDYKQKIQEALAPPELINIKKDTIIDNYLFELTVNNWNPETFYGNTTFIIKNKTTKKVLQTILSDNFWFNENLFFGFNTDYNFDGIKDLTFYNGNNGGYGTMTYDYYIYDINKDQFILNNDLSKIASGMGIEIVPDKKQIISYQKSGCCWHEKTTYAIINNKFCPILILEVDEDDFPYHKLTKIKWDKKGNKKEEIVERIIDFEGEEEENRITTLLSFQLENRNKVVLFKTEEYNVSEYDGYGWGLCFVIIKPNGAIQYFSKKHYTHFVMNKEKSELYFESTLITKDEIHYLINQTKSNNNISNIQLSITTNNKTITYNGNLNTLVGSFEELSNTTLENLLNK